MNIKILDSWLRDYVETKATPFEIAKNLSLSSVSVERVEKYGKDFVYDIEVTTNRADLMSVVGIARECAAILPRFGIKTSFTYTPQEPPKEIPHEKFPINIRIDPHLVSRICAVVMEVHVTDSPKYIQERLKASGIRSLNNLVDITNYVMREIGHPTHVFDYDRLNTKDLFIRLSRKGEKIVTLDKQERILKGGDIVADNGNGEIVDLLGVMGTLNSVVTDSTKKVLFFIDNNNPEYIRKTSMNLGIRSEAAVLNEKGVDPELATEALLRGINLFISTARGKVVSPILDIYPKKGERRSISISQDKINKTIGIEIPLKSSFNFLTNLGFNPSIKDTSIEVQVPSFRLSDIRTQEDLIEEIARIYGYHLLPSIIPPLTKPQDYSINNDEFRFEKQIKDAFKYWGFTEVYTMSMVSEELLDGPSNQAVKIKNPLTTDLIYMRKSLIPSLLQSVRENSTRDNIKIFEIANVYNKNDSELPKETLMIGCSIKEPNASFYEVKGLIEQLLLDLGIKKISFVKRIDAGEGSDIYVNKDFIGTVEILDTDLIDFEINFSTILRLANRGKIYKPVPKFPPVIEDIRITVESSISYEQIISLIKTQTSLIESVSLIDIYNNKKTFRIVYRDQKKSLTREEVAIQRKKIYSVLKKELNAVIG